MKKGWWLVLTTAEKQELCIKLRFVPKYSHLHVGLLPFVNSNVILAWVGSKLRAKLKNSCAECGKSIAVERYKSRRTQDFVCYDCRYASTLRKRR